MKMIDKCCLVVCLRVVCKCRFDTTRTHCLQTFLLVTTMRYAMAVLNDTQTCRCCNYEYGQDVTLVQPFVVWIPPIPKSELSSVMNSWAHRDAVMVGETIVLQMPGF